MEFRHDFVLKRCLGGWREIWVFKLSTLIWRGVVVFTVGANVSIRPKFVCQQSLETTTTFPRNCPLWSNMELYHDFVLKRCLKKWREVGVFKLCQTSTPKRCRTLLGVPEHRSTFFLSRKGVTSYFSVIHWLQTLFVNLSLYSTRLIDLCRGWSLGGKKRKRFL